jgi:hypothetical protein
LIISEKSFKPLQLEKAARVFTLSFPPPVNQTPDVGCAAKDYLGIAITQIGVKVH